MPSWRPAGDSWSASSRTRPAGWCSWTRPTLRKPAAVAGTQPSQTDRRRRCSGAEPAGSGRTPTTMRRSTSWCGRDFRPHPFRPAGLGLLHGEERSLPGRPCGQPQGLPRPVNRICMVSTNVYKSQKAAQLVRWGLRTPNSHDYSVPPAGIECSHSMTRAGFSLTIPSRRSKSVSAEMM